MRAAIDRAAILAAAAVLGGPGDPADAVALRDQLRGLYAIGRADLPLGRLVEGHVDARQIVARYGGGVVPDDAALGVWNADQPREPLILEDGRLTGAKAFASGAGVLSHALVTAEVPGGRQLVLVDLAATPPAIDRLWWRVAGMQRSETHVVRWQGAAVGTLIGAPGDYVREPWFGGGAIRFAAVQAGGIAALLDGTRAHLVATGRDGDPHQRARLADLYRLAQGAAEAVATAARHWHADDVATTHAHVAAARHAVFAAGEAALAIAEAAVGVQAMFVDHPLHAAITDLMVYLRQPGPDLQRDRAGAGVAAGLLDPAL